MKRHPHRVASSVGSSRRTSSSAVRWRQIQFRASRVVRTIPEHAHQVFGRPAYRFECREGSNTVLLFDARVDGEPLQGAVMIQDDHEGRVAELTVMMRPLSVVRTFAAIMESRLGLNLEL